MWIDTSKSIFISQYLSLINFKHILKTAQVTHNDCNGTWLGSNERVGGRREWELKHIGLTQHKWPKCFLYFLLFCSGSKFLIAAVFLIVSATIFLCPLFITSPCLMSVTNLPDKPKLIGHRGAPMVSVLFNLAWCSKTNTVSLLSFRFWLRHIVSVFVVCLVNCHIMKWLNNYEMVKQLSVAFVSSAGQDNSTWFRSARK